MTRQTARVPSFRPLVWLSLLLAITAIAYIPVLRAGFIWDDNEAIQENVHLSSSHGLETLWTQPTEIPQRHYWPVVYTTFWIEHQLWGNNPTGYHVTNVILHALNAFLVLLLIRRLRVPGAPAVAILFALHPVQVETVAWVIERKSLLSMLFLLASFHLFISYRRSGLARQYASSLLFYCLALLSKTIAVVLPPVLALYLWWQGRGQSLRRNLLMLIPYFAIGAVFAWFDLGLSAGKVAPSGLTLGERLVLASQSFWFYVLKLAWPHPLSLIYPRWTPSITSLTGWLSVLGVLVLLALTIRLWLRGARAVPFAIAVFFFSVAPMLGLVDFEYMGHALVADRYLYIGSVAGLSLGVAGAMALLRRLFSSATPGRLLLVGVSVCYLLLTFSHARAFHSMQTIFTDVLKKNPSAAAAHFNLGVLSAQAGETDEARDHFQSALRARPKYPLPHNGLGVILAGQGHLEEAVSQYEEAIKLDPVFPEAQNNLAVALARLGRTEEAKAHLRDALSIKPGYADARKNLAGVLSLEGNYPEAAAQYDTLFASGFDGPGMREAYAVVLARAGRKKEAETQIRVVLRREANRPSAHVVLGDLLTARGEVSGALDALESAANLSPDDARLWSKIGSLHQTAGDAAAAIAAYERALSLDSTLVSANNNLAGLLSDPEKPRLLDPNKAIELARRAVSESKRDPRALHTLASAYLAAKRTGEARALGREALEVATERGDTTLVAIIQGSRVFSSGREDRSPANQ